jgi:hypothetical protein
MRGRALTLLVGAALLSVAFVGLGANPVVETHGTPEIGIARVNDSADGTSISWDTDSTPNNGNERANGIFYAWETAEAFSPGSTVSTCGWNSLGIATNQPGNWAKPTASTGQGMQDMGSVWDSWSIGEKAAGVFEVFNTNTTSGLNYTCIYSEDAVDGDGSTTFGSGVALVPINDPIFVGSWTSNNTFMLKIAPQSGGSEVPGWLAGYRVYKSASKITNANKGTPLGDAALENGWWVYRDLSYTGGADHYAVRVKWNDATFAAPLYSYGYSREVFGTGHYQSAAIGPAGSSSVTSVNITYDRDCGCFGYTHLYYSKDYNSTWNIIGTEEDEFLEDGYCVWTAPGAGTYWWLATNDFPENDDQPAPGTPAEAGPYEITESTVSFGIPVQLGWNLVSMPVSLPALTLPAQLLDGDVAWDRVIAYDSLGTTDRWRQFNANWSPELNDLSRVEVSMGFWLHVTDAGDGHLNLTGYDPGETQISLKAGWNLVGYPTMTSLKVSSAFWGTGVDIVETFDPAEPYLTKVVGATYMMKPGEGYWVHVPADTVWTVDW